MALYFLITLSPSFATNFIDLLLQHHFTGLQKEMISLSSVGPGNSFTDTFSFEIVLQYKSVDLVSLTKREIQYTLQPTFYLLLCGNIELNLIRFVLLLLIQVEIIALKPYWDFEEHYQ